MIRLCVHSFGMLCVLGTLGSCCSSELSFAFRFLLSPEDFAPAVLDTVDCWTDWLTGKSPESLSREGFDEEYRLCWRGLQVRVMLATAARGTAEPMDGAAAATRRTEPGNMAPPGDRIVSGVGRGPSRAPEREVREKVTGHDAGGGVQTRLIPTFGHRSKLEGGGSPHADNLESLAPFKGLANLAVRPAYRMQIRGCPKTRV